MFFNFKNSFESMATTVPPFPTFDFVLKDSPVCHQSLRFWGKRASEVSSCIYTYLNALLALPAQKDVLCTNRKLIVLFHTTIALLLHHYI